MSALTLKTSAGSDLFDVSDAGAVTIGAALSAVGLAAGSGNLTSSGSLVLTSSNGATYTLKSISGSATLSTTGATTTITLAAGTLPMLSAVFAATGRITTTIASVGAGAKAVLNMNSSGQQLVEFGALTSGTTGVVAGALTVTTADELTVVISDGAGSDNTPSAGAIKYSLLALVPTAPTA